LPCAAAHRRSLPRTRGPGFAGRGHEWSAEDESRILSPRALVLGEPLV